MNKLVSIIVPVFNEEKVIKNLIDSILNQSYKKIEIIIVDDGSTDDTIKILKEYKKRITFFKRPHAERSVQRNFGAKKSKGNLLIFLDADMQLTKDVVKEAVSKFSTKKYKTLIIPEKTVGNNLIQKIRRFEREMYEGDQTIEVARIFDRNVFFEFSGYDIDLTGPEDYDLPYRISRKYPSSIGRIKSYLFHNEERLTFIKLLKKKYYYAQKGAIYAKKHPELIKTQGNILFRKAYLKSWKKFLSNPVLGLLFIFVRISETVSAVLGYISSVGLINFIKTLPKLILKK